MGIWSERILSFFAQFIYYACHIYKQFHTAVTTNEVDLVLFLSIFQTQVYMYTELWKVSNVIIVFIFWDTP